MASPIILRYYDYYDAHLAAHQFQLEGLTAEVFEFAYSASPWPGCEFRLLVFKEPILEDVDEVGGLEPGGIGAGIDTILRVLLVAGVGLVPLCLFFSILAEEPVVTPDFFIGLAKCLALWIVGAVVTISAYESFRREEDFGKLVILGVGWCICLGYLANFLAALLSLPLLIIDLLRL